MQTAAKSEDRYEIKVMTTEEAQARFDATVREKFGLASRDFILKYKNGEFENRDDCEMACLLMLLPFTGYSTKYGKQQSSYSE